ncbi:MAG: hypothetical protein ABNH02_03495 [Pseudomonadales bacterium]|jgi:hypothetical protein
MTKRHFDLSQYRCPLALLHFKRMLQSLNTQFDSERDGVFEFGDDSSCSDAYRSCLALDQVATIERVALTLHVTLKTEVK